ADDLRGAKRPQQRFDAIAGGDGYCGYAGDARVRTWAVSRRERADLCLHIIDFLVRDSAERTSVGERVIGRLSVDVHAHNLAPTDDKQALAERREWSADGIGVERLALDDELRAESGGGAVGMRPLCRRQPRRINGAKVVRRRGCRLAA